MTVPYREWGNQRDVILIIPGQPRDWIKRLMNQIREKMKIECPSAKRTVQITAPAMPTK